jgi:hypothetical protein
MAISYYPFENADTTETQYSALMRELQESGVCDSAGGTGLRVSVGTGSTVNILPGSAILRGFQVISDATENRTVTGPAASTRIDLVVARLDPTANTINFFVVAGTPGSGSAPAPASSLTDIFEIPLATVTVATSGTLAVADVRPFVGTRVRVHSNATRPAPNAVRLGQLAFNTDTLAYEYSNGAGWFALLPTLVNQATKWGPGSGYALVVSTSTPPVTANTVWIKPTA